MVIDYLVKFLNSQASTSVAGFLIIIVSIIAIYYHRKTERERLALDYLRELNSSERLISAQKTLKFVHFDNSVSVELIATSNEQDYKNLKKDFVHLLNYFESLAIGCKIGIYDKKTIILSRNQQIINTYKYSLPYIIKTRENLKNKNIFANLEWLAKELERLNKKNKPKSY